MRSKHAIAREIEDTREELVDAAKMVAVSLFLRNPLSLAVKGIGKLFRRRKQAQEPPVRIRRPYRNAGLALGTGVVAALAYRYWRRWRAA
jgi:hypothetical protein